MVRTLAQDLATVVAGHSAEPGPYFLQLAQTALLRVQTVPFRSFFTGAESLVAAQFASEELDRVAAQFASTEQLDQLQHAGFALRHDGPELIIQKQVGPAHGRGQPQVLQYRVGSPQEFQQVFWTVMFTP